MSDPSFRNYFGTVPEFNWPRFYQSHTKCLAHTERVLPPVVVALPSKINSIHLAHLSSEAGGRFEDECCSVQPTTQQLSSHV